MSLRRSCTCLAPWAAMALLGLAGCESPQKRLEPPRMRDDFGASLETQPITAESVGEKQMLHRRWQLELNGHASIPTGFFAGNGFQAGPSVGGKIEIETEKDLFVGVAFDWAQWEQSNGVKNPLADPSSLAGIKPDDYYDKLIKYDFLLAIDYDWTLLKGMITSDKDPLKLRLGGGVGATLVEGEVDPFLKSQIRAAGSTIDIVDYVGFLARIGVGLRWQVAERLILFTDASYDFVAPFTMEVHLNRERSEVSGDIDFGSINLGAGIAFEF